MNKQDLINKIHESTGVSKKDVKAVVDANIESIMSAVATGDDVILIGFGTFKAVKRSQKQGRNPKTNEPITIPAKVAPKFIAGKAFKDMVNG